MPDHLPLSELFQPLPESTDADLAQRMESLTGALVMWDSAGGGDGTVNWASYREHLGTASCRKCGYKVELPPGPVDFDGLCEHFGGLTG